MKFLALLPYVFVLTCSFKDFGEHRYFLDRVGHDAAGMKGFLCHRMMDLRGYAVGCLMTSLTSSVVFLISTQNRIAVGICLAVSVVVYALILAKIWKIEREMRYEDLYLKRRYLLWAWPIEGRKYLGLVKGYVISIPFGFDLAKAFLV